MKLTTSVPNPTAYIRKLTSSSLSTPYLIYKHEHLTDLLATKATSSHQPAPPLSNIIYRYDHFAIVIPIEKKKNWKHARRRALCNSYPDPREIKVRESCVLEFRAIPVTLKTPMIIIIAEMSFSLWNSAMANCSVGVHGMETVCLDDSFPVSFNHKVSCNLPFFRERLRQD